MADVLGGFCGCCLVVEVEPLVDDVPRTEVSLSLVRLKSPFSLCPLAEDFEAEDEEAGVVMMSRADG